ncbi:putative tartrate transporter [uncultured Pleomorphomonas sp.]|uniref:Putative tartrate transporter n=2 Tax=uncultured Pleomorphomonas sp. TaxID=442121 RepID=A0A212LNR5_9HYPH|nr:putative tartrate transporter [uncultured Pleomorphomonas sp.]
MQDAMRSGAKKVALRILPLLCLGYVAAYLDRINVSFAALQLNEDLNLSPAAYGLGAGLFFVGYVVFEVPSNLILRRVGAKLWISRIMISWGVISALTALVQSEATFYLCRFLLGVAEAGFLPGAILYVNQWLPPKDRARALSVLAASTALAGLIGSPLSMALLGLDGMGGLRGWQWLFVLEGIPAVVLGVLVLFALPDTPMAAKWLTDGEKSALQNALDREAGHLERRRFHLLGRSLFWKVGLLGVVYFCMVLGMYGVAFWMPQILQNTLDGTSLSLLGWYNAIPFLAAVVGMLAIGWSSDRFGERKLHVIGALVLASVGCVLAGKATGLAGCLVALSLASIGLWSVIGPFWAFTTARMGGLAAAVGVALINSIGNTGGFFGPYVMGWLKGATADYRVGLDVLALVLVFGAVSMGLVRTGRSAETIAD